MNKKLIIILIYTLITFTSITFLNKCAFKTTASQFFVVEPSKITTDYGKRIEIPDKPTDYKPISKELCNQYKAEMEQVIIDESSNVIKNADNYVNEAKKLRDKMLKNGYNESDNIYLTDILEIALPASSLNLYDKLMKITQEKYLKIPYTPIGTDHPNSIYYYLYPYFMDNNISFDKLNEIDNYLNKQYELVRKYMEEINSLNKRGKV